MIQNFDVEFSERHELFEFGDQIWLPNILRDSIRTYLNGTHLAMGYYKQWAVVIAKVLIKNNLNEVVMLGGGGIFLSRLLQNELRSKHKLEVKFYLTDLHPVKKQNFNLIMDDNIICVDEPVDMLNVPTKYKGLRVIAVAFHHLTPKQALEALENASNEKSPICIFEYTRNSVLALITSIFYPLFNFLISPFVRPYSFKIFIFSNIIPIMPLMVSFDGFISNLRTYSKNELLQMVKKIKNKDYQWEIFHQKVPLHPTLMTTLIGQPISRVCV